MWRGRPAAAQRPSPRDRGLRKHFGGVQAVNGVDLAVPPGDLRAIIGPNGAGKTTLFNLITGDIAPRHAATIFFGGEEVSGLPPHRLCRRGMGRTFQITSIFRRLTVLENVQTAFLAHHHRHFNLVVAARRRSTGTSALALLERVGLREQAAKPSGILLPRRPAAAGAGHRAGERAQAAAARRADAGMAPRERHEIMALVARIAATPGSPWCSPSTTWTWCSRWPGGSRCCTRARCSPRARRPRSGANGDVQRVYLGSDALMALLELSHVDTYYDDEPHPVRPVARRSRRGEVVCLLGRNGAGKTTTVRSIMGLTPPRAGRITLRGHDWWGCRRSASPGSGIGFVPEDRRVFPNLTVHENLEVARQTWGNGGGALDGRARLRAVPASCASGADRPAALSAAASSRCSPSRAR